MRPMVSARPTTGLDVKAAGAVQASAGTIVEPFDATCVPSEWSRRPGGRRARDVLRVAAPNDQLSAPAEDHVSSLDRRRGLLDGGGMVRFHPLPLPRDGAFAGVLRARRGGAHHELSPHSQSLIFCARSAAYSLAISEIGSGGAARCSCPSLS